MIAVRFSQFDYEHIEYQSSDSELDRLFMRSYQARRTGCVPI